MIWDKAQELGRLIGQSTEYQALRRAETTLREDKDTRRQAGADPDPRPPGGPAGLQGQMPDQATAEAYENAVRDLEMSPVGQAYVTARANFEKLMAEGESADQRRAWRRAPPAASSRWDEPRRLLHGPGRA